MTRHRRKLRTRLVIAMSGIAIGVLVITAVATIGLARRSAATTAQQQLETKAPRVARQLEDARPAACAFVRRKGNDGRAI